MGVEREVQRYQSLFRQTQQIFTEDKEFVKYFSRCRVLIMNNRYLSIKTSLLLCILLLMPRNVFAVNEMWSAETQSNLNDARTAGDSKYLQFKKRVDDDACSNDDYGLQYAIMYKATSDASYCSTAFSKNGGCMAGANRNKTRDCFVER